MEYAQGWFWSGRNEVRVLIQSFLWITSCQRFTQGLAHLNKLTSRMLMDGSLWKQQHRRLNKDKDQDESCPNHDTDRHSCLCCVLGSLPSPFWWLVLDQALNDFNSAAAALAWPVLVPSCLALLGKKGSHVQRSTFTLSLALLLLFSPLSIISTMRVCTTSFTVVLFLGMVAFSSTFLHLCPFFLAWTPWFSNFSLVPVTVCLWMRSRQSWWFSRPRYVTFLTSTISILLCFRLYSSLQPSQLKSGLRSSDPCLLHRQTWLSHVRHISTCPFQKSCCSFLF